MLMQSLWRLDQVLPNQCLSHLWAKPGLLIELTVFRFIALEQACVAPDGFFYWSPIKTSSAGHSFTAGDNSLNTVNEDHEADEDVPRFLSYVIPIW